MLVLLFQLSSPAFSWFHPIIGPKRNYWPIFRAKTKRNFCSGKTWKIIALINLALALMLFAVAIYNVTRILPQSLPGTLSGETTTLVGQTTTSQAQRATDLSEITTYQAHKTTSYPSENTTTSEIQTTTTMFTTSDYHEVFSPYMPYGKGAGDSEYTPSQGVIELETSIRSTVFGCDLKKPTLQMVSNTSLSFSLFVQLLGLYLKNICHTHKHTQRDRHSDTHSRAHVSPCACARTHTDTHTHTIITHNTQQQHATTTTTTAKHSNNNNNRRRRRRQQQQ